MDKIAETIACSKDLSSVLDERSGDISRLISSWGHCSLLGGPGEAAEKAKGIVVSAGVNVLRGVLHTLREMGFRSCRIKVSGFRFDIFAVDGGGFVSHLVVPYGPCESARPEAVMSESCGEFRITFGDCVLTEFWESV